MPICPKGHDSAATDYCDECGAAIGGLAVAAVTADPNQPPVVASPDPSLDGYGSPCPSCQTPRAGRFCEVCGHDFATEAFATAPMPTVPGGAPMPTVPGGAPMPTVPGGAPMPTVPGGAPMPTVPGGAPTPAPAAPASAYPGVPAAPASSINGAAVAAPASPASSTVEGTVWRAVATADRAFYDRMLATIGFSPDEIPFPAYCPERRFDLAGPELLIGRSSRSRGISPQVDLTGPPLDPAVSHTHAVLRADGDGWTLVDLESGNGTYLNDGLDALKPYVATKITAGDRIHLGAWTTLTLLRD